MVSSRQSPFHRVGATRNATALSLVHRVGETRNATALSSFHRVKAALSQRKKAPSHSALPRHDETETAATIPSQSPTPPEDEVDLVTHANETNVSVVPSAAVDEAVIKAATVQYSMKRD